MTNRKNSILRNQRGFTLIEIISVLVLVGILAAVAVPKYIDLTAQAEIKSVATVKAEMQARANLYYANFLLDSTDLTHDQTLATWEANENDLGADYSIVAGAGGMEITVVSSGNKYNIVFTAGTDALPAVFGIITAL